MARSRYLSGLIAEQRGELEKRLFDRQNGRCYICDEKIDLVLHRDQLDIDHIDLLSQDGLDADNNFALTHASCNRSKGASNLQVARRLAHFEKLQREAKAAGHRGANLGDVLGRHGGAKTRLRLRRDGTRFISVSRKQATTRFALPRLSMTNPVGWKWGSTLDS